MTRELYPYLKDQLTAERFKAFYSGVVTGAVDRYVIDHLWAMNFVAQGALGGGVSRSLCLDNYGKALSCCASWPSSCDIPENLRGRLRGLTPRQVAIRAHPPFRASHAR